MLMKLETLILLYQQIKCGKKVFPLILSIILSANLVLSQGQDPAIINTQAFPSKVHTNYQGVAISFLIGNNGGGKYIGRKQ